MSVTGHPLQDKNHALEQPPHVQIHQMLILPVNRY
jgi:hypothetical protein